MTTTKTAICKLNKDTLAIGVHGVTGRDLDEGTLIAGTLVRNCVTHAANVDGAVGTTFDASTDGGASWYPQRSYESFAGRLDQVGQLKTIVRNGVTFLVPRA